MIKLFIALVPIVFILFCSEYLWRKKIVKGEKARKFIHILAGCYMAFWSLYLPFDGIFILGISALTLLLYSRFTNLFHAIYAVKRKTYGELFYAVALIVCALLGREPWIFTISILFLALADGGAAVVGRYWGKNNGYKVFGSKYLKKSMAGTTAFVVLAYVSIAIGWLISDGSIIGENVIMVFALLPAGAVILENIMPFGLDNLATPLFATLLLNSLL